MPISQKSLHVMLHLFLVYISWGSTYIGYKFSLGVAGPFMVGGSRMVLGGILLGIIEIFGKSYISTELGDAIVLAILIVILLVKPAGLLGKKIREKV